MDGLGRRLLVGWGFRAANYKVSPIEFFEDTHTTNTSEQVKEDVWTNWYWGAFVSVHKTSYVATSQDTGLYVGRVLGVDVSTYSATGQDTGLKTTRILPITYAGNTVTANSVSLSAYSGPQAYSLAISRQDYTISWQSVVVTKQAKISLVNASNTVSISAGLVANRRVPVVYSGSTVTINGISIARGVPFPMVTINLTATGNVSFLKTNVLQFGGSYTVSGSAELSKGILVKRTKVKRKYWL